MTAAPCPACGADGCRAAYESLLARVYGSPTLLPLRQLAVDAHAVQHPAAGGRAADQSVALHLMTLCLFVERGVDPAQGPALHKRMLAGFPAFAPLDPPDQRGTMTVAELPHEGDDAALGEALRHWADAAWAAWAPHHGVVRGWLARGGG